MSIQWGRVLLAAFLMELVLIAIAVPLTLSGAGWLLDYVVPPLSFIARGGTGRERRAAPLTARVRSSRRSTVLVSSRPER